MLAVLSGAGTLGVACAEANLSAEDDTSVPLPDRQVGAVDGALIDVSIEEDAADAADAAPPSYLVFVSSASNVANYGGVVGADAVCNQLAIAGGLSGKWVAWMSTKDGAVAIDRVTSPGPWLLTTGELVASTKTKLVSGTLEHAIDHDEKKTPVAASAVWTGTGPDGVYLTNDCDDWTTGSKGRTGVTTGVDGTWTSANVDDCTDVRRLYCFQY